MCTSYLASVFRKHLISVFMKRQKDQPLVWKGVTAFYLVKQVGCLAELHCCVLQPVFHCRVCSFLCASDVIICLGVLVHEPEICWNGKKERPKAK